MKYSNTYDDRYYNKYQDRRAAYFRRSAVVRREQVLIQKALLLTVFICTLLFSIIFISSRVNASFVNDNRNSVKMYKSIMIYSGDTLESIAAEYMSEEYASVNKYVNEVLSINGLSPASKLIPGNRIIIPYYMSESINNSSYDPVIEISLAQ